MLSEPLRRALSEQPEGYARLVSDAEHRVRVRKEGWLCDWSEDVEAGSRALQRLSARRRRRRSLQALRTALGRVKWTWFWTQTFRPEFGVRSPRLILTWWIPLLRQYMNGRLLALFCATEPHRKSGLWHAHMLVRERLLPGATYREHKEWAFRSVGMARVFPYNGRGGLEYTTKYLTKGHFPWEWRLDDGKVESE